MMTDKFNLNEKGYLEKINRALENYIPSIDLHGSKLIDAMRYSLLNNGKRLRPILTLEFCHACGGNINTALPFACAVEMIHAYSLIHDDLPCMDDDDMRRGKPSNHIVFGEDTALLAGDALLNLAFETMLNSPLALNTKTQGQALRNISEMAKFSGISGMIGGQAIDLYYENKTATTDIIKDIYYKKTSAIIQASCKMGCICAGADDDKIKSAEKYASYIGLAFQIKDDILDITSDTQTLGKPINSDLKSDKSTYVSLYGIDKSQKAVSELTSKAINILENFDGDVQFLINLALYLENRQK